MRTLRLMADYDCSPLWEPGGDPYPINPEDIPISTGLHKSLWAWADTFDATLNHDDPTTSGFTSHDDEGRFIEEGRRLSECLRTELGMNFQIEYRPI